MNRLIFTGFYLLIFYSGFSQSAPTGSLQELRKIPIPPSPNASAIGKFGDIPVSLSTGIPSISIPFYKYADQQKSLILDVSLSYHAGGHKVEDMPSNVGLGWALNAGGVVSRSMRGRPDDDINGYINSGVLPYYSTVEFDKVTTPTSTTPISKGVCYGNSSDYNSIKNISENQLDGECDIFQFSVGGISGKFFFKKNGDIQLISQSNIKITYTRESTGALQIKEFVITDSEGISYIFDQKELTEVVSSLGGQPPLMPIYSSSWYISKIRSADGQDEIVFNYTSGADLIYEGGFSDSYRSSVYPGPQGDVYMGTTITQSYNTIVTHSPKRISSISFPDGTEVSFYYNLARLDYVGDNALTAVYVRNDGLEKRFLLNYEYFESPICYTGNPCTPPIAYSSNDWYKRLKLKSVQESDGINSLQPYTFEYNTTPLPNRNAKAQDWWGYYNGIGGNSTLASSMPSSSYPGGFIFGGDKPPSEQYTKAWVMEKLFYPTGGNTRFVYELNDGFKETTYRSIGGLRVKRTEDFDGVTGKISTTNYNYKKTDNTSSGTLQTLPNYSNYWTTVYHDETTNPPTNPWIEYFMNETSNPTQTLSYFGGSPVIYTRVKVDKDNNGISNGYSIHEFTAFTSTFVSDNNFPFVQKQDLDWSQGLSLKDTIYNSSNSIIRSVENEYQHYFNMPLISDQQSRNLIVGLLRWDALGTFSETLYGARAYYLAYGRSELKKTTEKLYGQGGAVIENVTDYTYDSQYFLRTKTTTKSSKGNNIETRFYYPFNYNATGFPNVTSMLNANRVSPLISQEIWEQQGGTFYLKSALVNDYGVFNSSMIKESKAIAVETKSILSEGTVGAFNPSILKRHSSFKDQVLITGYDSRGRYTDMAYVGQFNYAFLWGRNNNFPVCIVKNATSPDIAYTSFEIDGNGPWVNINPTYILSGNAVTGSKYYQQTGFIFSKNGLSSSNYYTVSYWSKNGAYTVTGNQANWPKTIRTIIIAGQSWTCYEHLVTGQTSITLSGSGAIDELRLHPKNAEMSTTTYNPLTGVTSQCDVGNYTSYYEYDNFFRLHLVKDHNGNILKKICYSYNNTSESCSGITNNPIWQPTGSVQCQSCPANNSYTSDNQEREEKDMNPSSPTYNTYRWVNVGKSSSCLLYSDWQTISSYCEQFEGHNTGILVAVQKDMNPCSPTYNQTKNVLGQSHTACPPPGCNTNNCPGPDKKCVNGICETGMKIYTSSVYNEFTNMYDCTYHYEWSDNSWSQDYVEQSGGECPVW